MSVVKCWSPRWRVGQVHTQYSHFLCSSAHRIVLSELSAQPHYHARYILASASSFSDNFTPIKGWMIHWLLTHNRSTNSYETELRNKIIMSCTDSFKLANHGFLTLLLIAITHHQTQAHSNFNSPFPYNSQSCRSNESWCIRACPPIRSSGNGKARNTPQSPSAEWRRGQTVTIEWHKNNHFGGFYRRSLVPVDKMFDPKEHERFAFEYGCWSAGSFKWGKKPECGTDQHGRAYRNTMVVPSTLEDGDYVLAQVWYGGFDWRRDHGRFPEYTSCAYIRIKGGASIASSQPIKFEGGDEEGAPAGKCYTTQTYLDECGGKDCSKNKVTAQAPVMPSKTLVSTMVEKQYKTQGESVWAAIDCNAPRPSAPIGDWGTQYSEQWWNNRAQFLSHSNYCSKCSNGSGC